MALRSPLADPAPRFVPHRDQSAARGAFDASFPDGTFEEVSTNDEVSARPSIAIRGAAYLAYCKPWAPAFEPPDEDDVSA